MAVIETDGVDTQKGPKVDVLSIIPGQRYSVIVLMDQPEGNYWIRGVAYPAGPGGLAILQYESNPEGLQALSKVKQMWGSEERMNDKDKDVSSGTRDRLAQCSKT